MNCIDFHSAPLSLPRLFLASLHAVSSDHNALCVSGHGSSIELYSDLLQIEGGDSCHWKLLDASDAFADSKCTIHGISPFVDGEDLSLFCIAERECVLLATEISNLSGEGHILNANGIKDRKNTHWRKKKHWHFSGWILNAKLLEYGTKIVLHSATNSLELLDLSTHMDELPSVVQLESSAFVTASLLHGDTWSSLQVFAGSCFGAIHLYLPANSSNIQRTFTGNNGMPFVLCTSSKWLFSVGDDRSLRVWNWCNGEQLFCKFAHGARPYSMALCERKQIVVTGDAESVVCVWRWGTSMAHSLGEEIDRLVLEQRIELCDGSLGALRCILILERNTSQNVDLLIGSERGAFSSISLMLNTSNNLAISLPINKVNAFAFAHLDGALLLICLDENRKLVIERVNTDISKQGCPIERNEAIFSDNSLLFRPDIFVYSNFTKTLALCSESNCALYFISVSDESLKNCASSPVVLHFDCPVCQILWIPPEATRLLLVVCCNGKATIYRIGNITLTNDISSVASHFSLMRNSSLPKLQCSLLIGEENDDASGVLLLGTRSGTLLAYSIPSGKCLLIYRNAHGSTDDERTLTALRIEAITTRTTFSMNGKLMSMGRDGLLKRWTFCWNRKDDAFSLFLISIRHLPMEWPSAFFTMRTHHQLVIGGFRGANFILMDYANDFIICTHRCGGGNRRWQFLMSDDEISNNSTYRFAYIQKGRLNCALLKPIKFHQIQPSLHFANIVSLANLRQMSFGDTSSDINCAATDKLILISGGKDRQLVLSIVSFDDRSHPKIVRVDSAKIHRSSIESICVIDNLKWSKCNCVENEFNSNKFVLSVGGRSEICAWLLTYKNDAESQLRFLCSTQLIDDSSSFDQDCRLIAVHYLTDQFFAVLCSDGTIRIVHLWHNCPFTTLQPHSNWTIRIPSLAMFSSMIVVEPGTILAISSAGQLHAFYINLDSLEHQNNPHFYHELSPPLSIEQCALSSLALARCCQPSEVPIQILDIRATLLFVCSESGRIIALKYHQRIEAEPGIEIVASADWHSSTITAIDANCISSYLSQSTSYSRSSIVAIFTVSLDCRLTLGHYDWHKISLFPCRQFPLCLSDPASLLVLAVPSSESNAKFTCLIAGAGLEHVEITVNINSFKRMDHE